MSYASVHDAWLMSAEAKRAEEAKLPAQVRRRIERARIKSLRRAYLARKPRCASGRVAVEAVYFTLRDAGEQEGWLCRGHCLPDEDPQPDPCMCIWRRTCGGLGYLECRGCGGDNCICTCGGETDCDGCEDCEMDDDALDEAHFDEDHDWDAP